LGYENGKIQKFNLQSGSDSGIFAADDSDGSHGIHQKEVTGLGIDVLNHYLVSCSLDHTIKLWDFFR